MSDYEALREAALALQHYHGQGGMPLKEDYVEEARRALEAAGVPALLARLEAAERVVEAAEKTIVSQYRSDYSVMVYVLVKQFDALIDALATFRSLREAEK